MEIQAPMKQMGYDRAIVVFSPEGRMYQVEYARKAVEKATTVVGATFSNGVVLIAARTLQRLLVPENVEKISKLNYKLGIKFELKLFYTFFYFILKIAQSLPAKDKLNLFNELAVNYPNLVSDVLDGVIAASLTITNNVIPTNSIYSPYFSKI